MKNRNDQQLTQYEIPGGEGFNALPIAFNSVIARAKPEAISRLYAMLRLPRRHSPVEARGSY